MDISQLIDFKQYYKNELEFIHANNSVEVGLYFIIELLFRLTINNEIYRVANISTRTKKSFDSISDLKDRFNDNVPDLLIYKKNESNYEPDSVIEVKYLSLSRNVMKDNFEQIETHIRLNNKKKPFRLGIYTNGLEWHFISINKKDTVILGSIDNKTNKILEDDVEFTREWHKLLKTIKEYFD